jgi:hypothetical protein
LPEVPEDTDATNPVLRRYDSPEFPEFSKVSQRHAYFGLGKALLEFETAVGELEKKCQGGWETVWPWVNVLNTIFGDFYQFSV